MLDRRLCNTVGLHNLIFQIMPCNKTVLASSISSRSIFIICIILLSTENKPVPIDLRARAVVLAWVET